jgi:hypothetical protein
MTDIFRDIKDYEGMYKVSNLGRVKSLGNGGSYKTSRILKPVEIEKGYFQVGLSKNGKTKMCYVHRLVAEAFLPNPENLPEVNHKDENKTNNFVFLNEDGTVNKEKSNLEWCDRKYNNNYATRNERAGKTISKVMTNGKTSKRVLQLTLTGDLIREWPSTQECGRNGFYSSAVCNCCNGKQKSHKGFYWMYK